MPTCIRFGRKKPVFLSLIHIYELEEAARTGALEEVFGSGTAAVISPVNELRFGDEVMKIGDGNIGPISQKLYDTITGIQLGEMEGPAGWSVEVK